MDMQIDIYQCGSKHIHVILRGMAEGAVAFFDFDAFCKFVDQCQVFIQQYNSGGNIAEAPREEITGDKFDIPEAFLTAFEHDEKRNP